MDIRTLRHFVAVVQEEGISAAADVLRMSQPALSRQMKELENELGVTLFERGNRGRSISLTREGQVFYRRAWQIIELADRARAEVHLHDEIAGTIHITAAESNLMNIVALAIAQTRLLYPRITFDIHDDNGPNNVERLNNGIADFAVIMQPIDMTRFDHLSLPGANPLGIGMRADDPIAANEAITNELIRDMPLITSTGANQRRDLSGWLTQGTTLNIVSHVNLAYNAACLVRNGVGYMLTVNDLTEFSDPEHDLVWRPLDPPLDIRLSVIWRKDRDLSRVCQLFLQQLRTVITQIQTAQ